MSVSFNSSSMKITPTPLVEVELFASPQTTEDWIKSEIVNKIIESAILQVKKNKIISFLKLCKVQPFERKMTLREFLIQRLIIINFGIMHISLEDHQDREEIVNRLFTANAVIGCLFSNNLTNTSLKIRFQSLSNIFPSNSSSYLKRTVPVSNYPDFTVGDLMLIFRTCERIFKDDSLWSYFETSLDELLDFQPLNLNPNTNKPEGMENDLQKAMELQYRCLRYLSTFMDGLEKKIRQDIIKLIEGSATEVMTFVMAQPPAKRKTLLNYQVFLEGIDIKKTFQTILLQVEREFREFIEKKIQYDNKKELFESAEDKSKLWIVGHDLYKSQRKLVLKIKGIVDYIDTYFTNILSLFKYIEKEDAENIEILFKALVSSSSTGWHKILQEKSLSLASVISEVKFRTLKDTLRLYFCNFLTNQWPVLNSIWEIYSDYIHQENANIGLPEWLEDDQEKQDGKKERIKTSGTFNSFTKSEKSPVESPIHPVRTASAPPAKVALTWSSKIYMKSTHVMERLEQLKLFFKKEGISRKSDEDKLMQFFDNAIFYTVLMKAYPKFLHYSEVHRICSETMGICLSHLFLEQMLRGTEFFQNHNDPLWNGVLIKSFHDLTIIQKYCYIDLPKADCQTVLERNARGSLVVRYPYSYPEHNALRLRIMHQGYVHSVQKRINEEQFQLIKAKNISEDQRYISDMLNTGLNVIARILGTDKVNLNTLIMTVDTLLKQEHLTESKKICLLNASFHLCMLDSLNTLLLINEENIKFLAMFGIAFYVPLAIEQVILAYVEKELGNIDEGHDLFKLAKDLDQKSWSLLEKEFIFQFRHAITIMRYPFYSIGSSNTELQRFLKRIAHGIYNAHATKLDDEKLKELSVEDSKNRSASIESMHQLIFDTFSFAQLFTTKALVAL